METSKYLNIKRLYCLVRRDIVINNKTYLIAFAAVGGFLLLLLIGDAYTRRALDYSPIVVTFYLAFFIGGLIFTSKIFGELHQGERSYRYLTLPASTLEKLISKWLISSIGFIIVAYLGIHLVALLGGLISSALFEVDFHTLNLADTEFSLQAARYLVIHSIFFLGACAFRNHNFIKTLLAIFIVGLVISLFIGFLSYAFYHEAETMTGYAFFPFNKETLDSSDSLQTIEQLNKVVLWYVIAPFCLVASYFKLKERQV